MDSDSGRVWVVAGGHVVTILSMGTRIQEHGQCQQRSVKVNKDSWRRSGRSCYDWQADLSGRCWVRLDCNGGFKGWCTTLNRWPFCVMSALPWFVWWIMWVTFCGGKLSKFFSSARGISDILSWIFASKGKSPNFFQRNFFNHNYGNNSLNGFNYCTNLVKPIPYLSVLVAPHIKRQTMLKGITAALPATTSYHPL